MAVKKRSGKRGTAWVVELQIGGQRIYRSLGPGSTKSEARELETKIRDDYRRGLLGKTPNVTIDEAAARWIEEHLHLKSIKSQVNHLEAIRPKFRGRPLTEIHKVAEEVKRDQGKLKPATVNRRLALLRRIANLAYRQWEWLPEPLGERITMLPGEESRHTYLSQEQVETLAASCERSDVADAILIAAYTGLRRSELLGLTPEHIQEDLIVLGPRTKNGQPRVVPLPQRVEGCLQSLPFGFKGATLHKHFRRAAEKAEMPEARFHDLRHSYASWLANARGDLFALRDLLGHSNVTTTSRYSHLMLDRLREVTGRLDE